MDCDFDSALPLGLANLLRCFDPVELGHLDIHGWDSLHGMLMQVYMPSSRIKTQITHVILLDSCSALLEMS
jgi:hypothetical protein